MSKSNSRFREYFLNTSFHGYRFIAEEGRHWSEKLFWIIVCSLSWLAIYFLIRSAWYDFQNNAVSFVVDTNYLNWDTNFPAVVVCETDNLKNIAEVSDRVYGDPHDYILDEVVKEMVFFKGLYFYTMQTCGPEIPRNDTCFIKDFSEFSKEVRSPCKDLFRECKWKETQFECCQYFHEIDTEMGLCYGINSIQTRQENPERFPMISNKETGPGALYIEINGFSSVYIFGQQEVPSLTSLATDFIQITPHVRHQKHFAVKEIENQPEVKYVSLEQRKCRFDEDNNLDVYRSYSYSACSVQCRKKAQIEKCGCVHHHMPNTSKELWCNIDGIYCLNKHSNELSVLKPPWSNRTGLVCGCLPSCTEIEISVVREEKEGTSEEFATVELFLERLPTERYKRNVVRGKLDLVVSMGSATALFLGASLLSFVEIIYYFVVKPLVDVMKYNNNAQDLILVQSK